MAIRKAIRKYLKRAKKGTKFIKKNFPVGAKSIGRSIKRTLKKGTITKLSGRKSIREMKRTRKLKLSKEQRKELREEAIKRLKLH